MSRKYLSVLVIAFLSFPVLAFAQAKKEQKIASHDIAVVAFNIAMNAVTRCTSPQGEDKKACYRLAIQVFSRMASNMPELIPAGMSRDEFSSALEQRAGKALAELQ